MSILKKWILAALIIGAFFLVIPILFVKGINKEKTPKLKKISSGVEIIILNKKENLMQTIDLEEYIKGVVVAEMPAVFNEEALKAQAVAARTYAYGRKIKLYGQKDGIHKEADVCTDSTHCQAWIPFEEAFIDKDEKTRDALLEKIHSAVESTKGVILKYQGKVANPLFHSNSGGMTEDAKDVFLVDVPYLKSVLSLGEEDMKNFESKVKLSWGELKENLEEEYREIKIPKNYEVGVIKILERTQSDRVKTIKIGNKKIEGRELRRILGLRSTNFKVDVKSDMIIFEVKGNGHGVGMSQWGANYLAKNGASYKEILEYYYKGIDLEKI